MAVIQIFARYMWVLVGILLLCAGCAHERSPAALPDNVVEQRDRAFIDAVFSYYTNTHRWPKSIGQIEEGATFGGIAFDRRLYQHLAIDTPRGGGCYGRWIWPEGTPGEAGVNQPWRDVF